MTFGDEMRPVKLTTVVRGYPQSRNDFLFERRLNDHLAGVIAEHSKGKPTLVFCRQAFPCSPCRSAQARQSAVAHAPPACSHTSLFCAAAHEPDTKPATRSACVLTRHACCLLQLAQGDRGNCCAFGQGRLQGRRVRQGRPAEERAVRRCGPRGEQSAGAGAAQRHRLAPRQPGAAGPRSCGEAVPGPRPAGTAPHCWVQCCLCAAYPGSMFLVILLGKWTCFLCQNSGLLITLSSFMMKTAIQSPTFFLIVMHLGNHVPQASWQADMNSACNAVTTPMHPKLQACSRGVCRWACAGAVHDVHACTGGKFAGAPRGVKGDPPLEP